MLTCRKCKQRFDADKVPAFKIGNRMYIHLSCRENEEGEVVPLPEKKTDPILDYCKKIFGDKANYPMIKKQLKTYREEYKYTDSGILKCLQYWYEVKHNDTSEAKGAIGIVPYIWNQVYDYYLNLYEMQLSADSINIKEPQEKEIFISMKPRNLKRRIFKFWETEGEELDNEKE